jgi:peptide/nickel transport system substrate-binding protein
MITADLIEKLDTRRYNILSGKSNSVQLLALNNNVKPFDDIRVRHAINYAVDVREIIDTAFYGRGEPSGSPLIPGLRLYYNEALQNTYPVDLARARALMAEAGYSNGFSMEIKVPSNYTMHVDTAQVIVNQLARINIRATIRLVDWATWLTDVYRGRNYEATIVSFDGNTLSPQSFLSRYVSTASGNLFNFNNTNYDSLYASILRETSEANRIRLYKDAQKMISDEAPAVFIQDIFAFKVFSGGFKGAVNDPLYVIDFSTIYRD